MCYFDEVSSKLLDFAAVYPRIIYNMGTLPSAWKFQSSAKRNLTAASIGVYLFFISVAFVQPACACLPEEPTLLNVSEMSFSRDLRNPCSLVNESSLEKGKLVGVSTAKILTVLNLLKIKALNVKEDAEYIFKNNVVQDCPSLELPFVPVVPSESLSNNGSLDVLGLFYTSLLNHTVNMYFISEQLQRHTSDPTCSNVELSANVSGLANNMKELMCRLRLSYLLLEQNGDGQFDDSILNEQLIDQPDCSRRSLRECQIIKSTVKLLERLCAYINNTVLIEESD